MRLLGILKSHVGYIIFLWTVLLYVLLHGRITAHAYFPVLSIFFKLAI